MTEQMDLNVSGTSTLPGGDYRSVNISGAGRLEGSLRCLSLVISGAGVVSGDVDCRGKITVSGSGTVNGNVRCEGQFSSSGAAKIRGTLEAAGLQVSGSCELDRDCTVQRRLEASGAAKFGGAVQANSIVFSGATTCGADVSAEDFRCSGICRIPGLLNAENVEFRLCGDSDVGDIGGSSILVRPEHKRGLYRFRHNELRTGTVEGDNVDLEYTVANTVRGNVVRIGPGCKVRRVEFSESLVVSPEAQVKEQVQVDQRELPEGFAQG